LRRITAALPHHFVTTLQLLFSTRIRAKLCMMNRLWLASPHIRRALLIVILALGGCQSTSALPTEDRVADFASIKSKAAKVQLTVNRIPIDATRGKPLEVAVHENANARHDRLFVFVHGVFSDSRMWRYLCWDLGNDYDVMAIDLLGCGASDRPDPAEVAPDGYGPDALGKDVLHAVRTRIKAPDAHPGLRVTLVGHSLGAMTILNMWAEPSIHSEFKDVLDHVDSIVLLSPPDIASNCRRPIFQEIDGMTDWRMTMADVFGVLTKRCIEATVTGVADPSLATKEEADRLIEIMRHASTRHAGQAMLRQAIPRSKERVEQIIAGYANVRIPCLIIWGAQDDLFPTAMAYNLTDRLPNAKLRIVDPAMHGLATERPKVCSDLLREFVTVDPKTAPKITVLNPTTNTVPQARTGSVPGSSH
jgi:pimeloyl-ACP methyl ester carboxylesterase